MNENKINPQYRERQISLIRHFLDTSILNEAYKEICPLEVKINITEKHVPFAKRKSTIMKKIKEGYRWSDTPFTSAYFHLKGTIKSDFPQENLYLFFDSGSEALLFDKNGEPLKGFSMGKYSLNDERNYATLKCLYPLKDLLEGNSIDLWLEATDNIYLREQYPDAGIFKKATVVLKDRECASLLYDIEILLNYLSLPQNDNKYQDDILKGLLEVMDLFMYSWPDRVKKAKAITSSLLKVKSSNQFNIYAIGHSHLDLAWLWPYDESKKKAVRTITNALYLLDRYPSFKYSISQAKQLEWIKEEYPSLFQRIMSYEKEGRIEILGGEYVENDLNNSGEETLFREMLYGQKFYLENFGHYADVGFYPDSFGFPPALPEVLRLTNQRTFYTAKMRINHQNIFPYSSFIWTGLDGKEVLAHLSQNPYGYNGFALPNEILETVKNSSDKSPIKMALYLYGAGDGGGGASEDMEERISLMDRAITLPNIKEEKAHTFFSNLETYSSSLPKYQGELYLENHQGTYTSAGENKRWNRHLEEKLKETEIYLAENGIKEYDEKLHSLWKDFLLLTFHDVLTGTCINEVLEFASKEYQRINNELDEILLEASNKNYSPAYKKTYYIHNFSPSQIRHYEKKRNSYLVFDIPERGESNKFLPYKGRNVSSLADLLTKHLKISFNEDGSFKSIIDLETNNELLDGYGNKLRVFFEPGDPKYANWNILENYRNQPEQYMTMIERNIRRYGPLYEIESKYIYKNSSLAETILIDDETREIRIHHSLDWKDDNYLLKTVFKLKNMPNEVISDTQFGYQRHSTKNDTSIHKSQYELCTYKWIDFSTDNQGIAFFNNARPGFHAKDGVVELSLLKTNNHPAKHLDQKHLEYDYAIYVHPNSFEESDVDSKANDFNSNVFYFKKKSNPENTLRLSNKDILVSCFKNAYNKDGIIVRLYNRSGKEQKCSISLPASYSKAILCSGLEDQIEPININETIFSPFEIKTILLYN